MRVIHGGHEPVVSVQAQQLFPVLALQAKVEDVQVFADARRSDALRHHRHALIEAIPQRHLSTALTVFCGHLLHDRVLKEVRKALGLSPAVAVRGTDATEGGDGDVFTMTHGYQLGVAEVRVDLHAC